jgi:hypothetical protein
MRDLNIFLSQHTPWDLPSEIPQTRTRTLDHRELNSEGPDMLYVSVRLEKHNQEEQPLIIVHKENITRLWNDPTILKVITHRISDYDPEGDNTQDLWEYHGRTQLNLLHEDHNSRNLHNDTRRRTLRLTRHTDEQIQNVRFASTILYVRILATTSLHLKRTHHSGENEGKEGLVRLTASHQQSLWRVMATIPNKTKIATTCRQMQGEVRASTSKSHSRVVLQLQVGRGSTDTSQRDLVAANAELSDTYNDHKQIGQLKFLALHAQGATIYLTSLPRGNDPPDTLPIVDPTWDLGWMLPHPEREIPTIARKKI